MSTNHRCQKLILAMCDPKQREQAFMEFFKENHPIAKRYLHYKCKELSPADVEDILQIFFLKIYRYTEKTEHVFSGKCEAWWRMVCTNTFIDWARKHERCGQRRMSSEFVTVEFDSGVEAFTDDRSSVYIEFSCLEHILEIMRKTHPRRWQVIDLAVKECSIKEIADLTGRKPNAVNNLISQARKQLLQLKKQHCV